MLFTLQSCGGGGGGGGLEYILSNRDWATTLHEEV